MTQQRHEAAWLVPHIRAVIRIERDEMAGRMRHLDRLDRCFLARLHREAERRCVQRARTVDEQPRLLVKREIAVGATDDEKIACSGAFGKKSKRRRLLWANLQPVVQEPALPQFCAYIASERVVADAGDDCDAAG